MVTKSTAAATSAIAQPEFPDIGIGHRHLHPRLHRPNDGRQIGRRHFAAQQHLVADDDGPDRVRITVGDRDRRLELNLGFFGVVRHPEALQHLQAKFGGDRRDLFEALIDRIDTDAIGQLRQLREVLLDLGGGNACVGIEAGSGCRGTARRKRNRAFSLTPNGDWATCTGLPSQAQTAAMIAVVIQGKPIQRAWGAQFEGFRQQVIRLPRHIASGRDCQGGIKAPSRAIGCPPILSKPRGDTGQTYATKAMFSPGELCGTIRFKASGTTESEPELNKPTNRIEALKKIFHTIEACAFGTPQ